MGAITAGGVLQGPGDNLLHFTDSDRPSADPQGMAHDRQLNTSLLPFSGYSIFSFKLGAA